MADRVSELINLLSNISHSDLQSRVQILLHDIASLESLKIIIENNPDFSIIRNALFMFSSTFSNVFKKLDLSTILEFADFFLSLIPKRHDIFSKSLSISHYLGQNYAQILTYGFEKSKNILTSQISEINRLFPENQIPILIYITCICQKIVEINLSFDKRYEFEGFFTDIYNLIIDDIPNKISNGQLLYEHLEFIDCVYDIYTMNGSFVRPRNLIPFNQTNEGIIQYFGMFEDFFTECSTECKLHTIGIMSKMFQTGLIQNLSIIIPCLNTIFQQVIDLDEKCALVLWSMMIFFANNSSQLFQKNNNPEINAQYIDFIKYIASSSEDMLNHDVLIMTPEIFNCILIFWSKVYHIKIESPDEEIQDVEMIDIVAQIIASLNNHFIELILSNPVEYESLLLSTDDTHTDLVRNYASFCMGNPVECVSVFLQKYGEVSNTFLSNIGAIDASSDASMAVMLCFASSLLISLKHIPSCENENAGIVDAILTFIESSNETLEAYRDSSENLTAELSLLKFILLLNLTILNSNGYEFAKIQNILSTDERLVTHNLVIGIFVQRIINDLRLFPGSTMLLRLLIKCLKEQCIFNYIRDNKEIRNLFIGMRNPSEYEFLGSVESRKDLLNFFKQTGFLLMKEPMERIHETFEEFNEGLYEAFSKDSPHIRNPEIAKILFIQIEALLSISDISEQYQIIFEWFSATHLDFFVGISKDIVECEHLVLPFMKLWYQLIVSEGSRISFPSNSACGIQLFVNSSKVLQTLNAQMLATLENAEISDITKPIKIFFDNARAALNAPYVCFGAFTKYGSDAVEGLIGGIESLISKASIQSLFEFPNIRESVLKVLNVIAKDHSEILAKKLALLSATLIAADANICFGDGQNVEMLAFNALKNIPTEVLEEASLLPIVERIGFHAMQRMIDSQCNVFVNALMQSSRHTNSINAIVEYVESVTPSDSFNEYYASIVSKLLGSDEEPPDPLYQEFFKFASFVSHLPISYQHIDLNPYID